MPSLSRRAADGLLAFLAGATALGASAANAQADPFALPKTATAAAVPAAPEAGPGPSEIEVDGQVRARLVELQGHGPGLTIDADNARVAGLPVPEGARGQIALSTLRLYRWSFDSLRQRLVVRLFNDKTGANFRDLARTDALAAERRTIAALRIDYDLNVNLGKHGATAAGLAGAVLVKGDFAVGTSFRAESGSSQVAPRATRLDSFAQTRIAGTDVVATAGDFISAGSASQRAVRMGGLQIASDFAQHPDLVTAPLPAFSGSVAVPTQLDILTADTRYKLGQLEPGEFTVRNVPLNPGRGSMAVLLKDSLGREVVRNVSFYVSNALLRPGLEAFAVNAGFVRRRYGESSNDYGSLAASAFYRRGLSPFLTLEASAESSAGIINFGSRADFTIGNVALSSVELRSSRDSVAGTGAMLTTSIESVGRGLGGRIGVSLPTASYRDVASHLGDRPPRKHIFANLSFDLRDSMPFQLSYVRQDAPKAFQDGVSPLPRSEILTASLFHAPNPRVTFNASVGMRNEQARSFFASAGLNIRLGARHSVSAGGSYGQGQSNAALAYQYSDRQRSGLSAQATLGTLNARARLTGSAHWESRYTALQGGIVASSGQIAGQLSASGSLIATGGTVYARSRSDNGYALVRAGDVAGIPIRLENRYVGKTDKRGRILLQDLRPMTPQQIRVDGDKLPEGALVLTSRHVIQVPQRAVGLVDIEAFYFRPVVLRIVDADGVPLPAGLTVEAMPSGRTTLVGFDGLVEHNAASGDTALLINEAGGACRVEVPRLKADEDGDAPLVCRRLPAIAADPEGPEDTGRRRRVARRN
jgi:outer membrane usher protein